MAKIIFENLIISQRAIKYPPFMDTKKPITVFTNPAAVAVA
jgi:hypothetical protein